MALNIIAQDSPYLRIMGDPTKFYGGSQDTLALLLEMATHQPTPRSVELTGFPGQGKSILLQYISHPDGALKQPEHSVHLFHLFPLYAAFRGVSRSSHPFIHLFQRFCEEYPQFQSRYFTSTGERLPDIPSEHSTIPPSATDAIEWLEIDLQMLASHGVRPVLLLDDFDIAFETLTRDETTRLRPLRDIVSFIIVTEQPLQKVNPEAAGSPFFQIMPRIPFRGLTDSEAKRLIREPAAKEGAPFPDEDVSFILEQAGRFPYLLILASSALWEMRQKLVKQLELISPTAPLPPEHRLVLQGRLREDFNGSFQLYWERLSRDERNALSNLVRDKEPNQWSDRERIALAPLEEKGLIELQKDGRYKIFSPLFVDYVRETFSPPPVHGRLSGMERKLYEYLRRYPDRVCTFDELARYVWDTSLRRLNDEQRRKTLRAIHVTISRLKAKLDKEEIISVRRQGYRFVP